MEILFLVLVLHHFRFVFYSSVRSFKARLEFIETYFVPLHTWPVVVNVTCRLENNAESVFECFVLQSELGQDG